MSIPIQSPINPEEDNEQEISPVALSVCFLLAINIERVIEPIKTILKKYLKTATTLGVVTLICLILIIGYMGRVRSAMTSGNF